MIICVILEVLTNVSQEPTTSLCLHGGSRFIGRVTLDVLTNDAEGPAVSVFMEVR